MDSFTPTSTPPCSPTPRKCKPRLHLIIPYNAPWIASGMSPASVGTTWRVVDENQYINWGDHPIFVPASVGRTWRPSDEIPQVPWADEILYTGNSLSDLWDHWKKIHAYRYKSHWSEYGEVLIDSTSPTSTLPCDYLYEDFSPTSRLLCDYEDEDEVDYEDEGDYDFEDGEYHDENGGYYDENGEDYDEEQADDCDEEQADNYDEEESDYYDEDEDEHWSSISPRDFIGNEQSNTISRLAVLRDLLAGPSSPDTIRYRGLYRKELQRDRNLIKILDLEYPLFFDDYDCPEDTSPFFFSGCTFLKSLELESIPEIPSVWGLWARFPRRDGLSEKTCKALDHNDAQGSILDDFVLKRMSSKGGKPTHRNAWAEQIRYFRMQLRQPSHPGKGGSFWALKDGGNRIIVYFGVPLKVF
ncbi:hypothetical protein MMC14_009309 [Varicellaria rhodocarpa]|nr:hypothetical protein [Varicellaria rhodocarpa]